MTKVSVAAFGGLLYAFVQMQVSLFNSQFSSAARQQSWSWWYYFMD